MWDRKVLKEKGKAAYRANRVTCIFAGFLLTFVSGSTSFTTSTSSWQETSDQLNIPPDLLKAIIAAAGGAVIIGFLLSVFVFAPVQVGLREFFRQNATDSRTGLSRENIGLAFSEHYTNVVASMFTTALFTFLWTLCFIVPGVIKAYSWRMVPYIIAEDPDITGTEARVKSAQMMNGSKWAAFVLDLSFLGWFLLGLLTLGILNLVFTSPYKYATDAELYRWLIGDRREPLPAEPVKIDDTAEPAVTAIPSKDEEDEDDEVDFII